MEKEEDKKRSEKWYKNFFHSKLCSEPNCVICSPLLECHYINNGFDTGGNIVKKYVCYCGTTGCKNLLNNK